MHGDGLATPPRVRDLRFQMGIWILIAASDQATEMVPRGTNLEWRFLIVGTVQVATRGCSAQYNTPCPRPRDTSGSPRCDRTRVLYISRQSGLVPIMLGIMYRNNDPLTIPRRPADSNTTILLCITNASRIGSARK